MADTVMRTTGFTGSLLYTLIFFVILPPCFLVLRLTFSSPLPPAGILFSDKRAAVHPHPAEIFSIKRSSSPLLWKTKL
jgi:hypothetical protein